MRVVSSDEEEPPVRKRSRKGKEKETVTYAAWEEAGSSEEGGGKMADEEALKKFLEDAGVKWLEDQCRSSIKFSSAFLTQYIDKNKWNGEFDERIGKLAAWPGKESVDGLRCEHLSPDCELRHFSICSLFKFTIY